MHRLALLALVACGPSAATLETARYARYDTAFSTVWNAVTEEVRQHYANLTFEDAVHGEVATGWKLIDTGTKDQSNTPVKVNTSGSLSNAVTTQSSTLGSVPGVPVGI